MKYFYILLILLVGCNIDENYIEQHASSKITIQPNFNISVNNLRTSSTIPYDQKKISFIRNYKGEWYSQTYTTIEPIPNTNFEIELTLPYDHSDIPLKWLDSQILVWTNLGSVYSADGGDPGSVWSYNDDFSTRMFYGVIELEDDKDTYQVELHPAFYELAFSVDSYVKIYLLFDYMIQTSNYSFESLDYHWASTGWPEVIRIIPGIGFPPEHRFIGEFWIEKIEYMNAGGNVVLKEIYPNFYVNGEAGKRYKINLPTYSSNGRLINEITYEETNLQINTQ